MHERRIYPDFNKLKHYFPNTDDETITLIKSEGMKIRLNYSDEKNQWTEREKLQFDLHHTSEEQFTALYKGLIGDKEDEGKKKFRNVKMANGSTHEIFLLALIGNEKLQEEYKLYIDFNEDDIKAKEISKFLLNYVTADAKNDFKISTLENIGTESRPIAKSAAVKNPVIAKWMCNVIYDAVVQGKFPLEVGGERIFTHLGISPFGGSTTIDLKLLEQTASMKLDKPEKHFRQLMAFFCLDIQPFLEKFTGMINPKNQRMPNDQTVFFYDILFALKYIPVRKTGITDANYMHTIIGNL